MFKTFGVVDRKIGMPIMKRKKPLREIMNRYEVMQLLVAPKLMKLKIAFVLAYGSDLRINELVNVQTRDIDLVRKVVHIKNGKGGYDSFVPISDDFIRGYKGIFMAELKNLHKLKIIELSYPTKEQLYKANWVIYAKRPSSGPNQVIEHLGRYSHKVAISNHRIIDYDDQKVIFKWKNYRNAAKQEVMQISTREFLRRLSLHVLPHKFLRIRHYGILNFHGRAKVIPKIQKLQKYTPIIPKNSYNLPLKIDQCQSCKSTNLKSYPLHPIKTKPPR